MQTTNFLRKSCALLFLSAMGLPGLNMAYGSDFPPSEPLDETVAVQEQSTSGESDEVPPEPVPPSEYQPLDSRTPALVAEEILRLRDALGTSPLTGRPGFRPLTLANESDEDVASPAPWEREDDRRDFRDRLQGMASRPVLAQPHGVPYGVRPYPNNPPAYMTAPAPQFHVGVPWNLVGELPPQPVQIPCGPYGYQPVAEGCHMTMSAPSFVVAEMQGQKQIDILRQTAHQLEETAHQLECCEQFERADQVRNLAEQLRQDARRGRRAEEATAVRTIRPAVTESASLLIRAALSAREVDRGAEEPTCQRAETESVDAEPSCPACPTLQKKRRGVSVEYSAPRPE